jgi:chromosome partitioning protein
MHTLALISRKGGTGKSTLAIGLGIAAAAEGHKVCLIETDPLGTISNWRRRRNEPEPTVEIVRDGYELSRRLPFLARCGVTLSIVDTAGGWSDTAAAAIAGADLCLIPARPSPADIEAAAPTLAAIREASKPFAFILNQAPARSQRADGAGASLAAAAAALDLAGVVGLPAVVLRNDQQDALGAGLAITEFAHDGKSAHEIRALWQWTSKRLNAIAPIGMEGTGANSTVDLRVAG